MSAIRRHWQINRAKISALAGLGLLFALLFVLGMTKRLDHDEHQFVASGALLARQGLLPYRDYPYFHTPYLAFIYAALFRLGGHLLFLARLFSVVCGFGTVAIVGLVATLAFKEMAIGLRTLMVVAIVLVLIGNPVFTITTGRAWNHDLPTLLLLLALFACRNGVNSTRYPGWAMLAGALMGIAVGVRLTFAPICLAMASFAMLPPSFSSRRRVTWTLVYCVGVLVALLPATAIFYCAPRQFQFGNFEYPTLNTAYRIITGYKQAMTPIGKLEYIATNVFNTPASGAIIFLVAWVVFLYLRRSRQLPEQYRVEIVALVLTLLGTLVGSLAPTPLFVMYFFTPLPLLVLIAILLAAPLFRDATARKYCIIGFTTAAILCIPQGLYVYRPIFTLWQTENWEPLKVHRVGIQVANIVRPHSKILTLAPIIPLEGNLDIVTEYATGPFALRVATMVPKNEEFTLHLLDLEEVAIAGRASAFNAILTESHDPILNETLLKAVEGLGFERHLLRDGYELWLQRSE